MFTNRQFKNEAHITVVNVAYGIYFVTKDRKGFFERYSECKHVSELEVIDSLNKCEKVAIFDSKSSLIYANFCLAKENIK